MHQKQQSLFLDNQPHQHLSNNSSHLHTIDQSFQHIHINNQSKIILQKAISFLSNYLVLDPTFPITLLKNSTFLQAKGYKQATYYGEMKNGKKHGWGIMNYHSEKIYEGQWQNDKKHGHGVQKMYNQSFYKGNYADGKPQGQGYFIWANGQKYEGMWHKGLRHGSGTWIGTKGDSYSGEWKEGNSDGYGIYTNQTGDIYEGQFKQCLKHGKGIEKFMNGHMYRGHYENGKPSGQGAYYWQNGSYFKGIFLNGLRNGKGIWKRGTGNSDKYEGEYKNDKKWGYGQFEWASGNSYKGNYEADFRNGYGEMYWVNGSIYKGQWSNGIQHGKGQIFIPGEGTKIGRFENNIIIQVYSTNLNAQKDNAKLEKRKITTISSDRHNQKNQFLIKKNSEKQKVKIRSLRKKEDNTIHTKGQEEFEPKKQLKVYQSTKINLSEQMVKSKREKSQKLLAFLGKQDKFHSMNESNQVISSQVNYKKNSKAPTSRTQSKEKRLLHSSFYLYKLNQRHSKEVKEPNRVNSSLMRLSKKIAKNFNSQNITITN